MDQVDRGPENLDGEECEDLPLEQEDDLHHDGEHGVRDHHRDGEVHKRPTLARPANIYFVTSEIILDFVSALPKCEVRNVLKPNGINNLRKKEERKDPQS